MRDSRDERDRDTDSTKPAAINILVAMYIVEVYKLRIAHLIPHVSTSKHKQRRNARGDGKVM